MVSLGEKTYFGILPFPFLLVLIFMIIAGLYMKYRKPGRDRYAIGSNSAAAQLVGIKVFQRTFLAFVFSGATAGLAGVFYLMRFAQVDATAFYGQELGVVAAVVIGGIIVTYHRSKNVPEERDDSPPVPGVFREPDQA